jgi:twitching motility protein PilT
MTHIETVLKELVLRQGSDLHLKVGRPPLMRISSDLLPTELPVVDEADMEHVLRSLLGEAGFKKLQTEFEVDAAYMIPDLSRFRINAFKAMGQYGVAIRAIPLEVPTIDGRGLPAVLKDICLSPQGMVLMTGPTGSGKSTSLAAMIEQLNQTQPLHIVTIEDPIEFVYRDHLCTIRQRQLGSDVRSLGEALRRVLRQDPDVILMGEMRDAETIELAMHAAETGHLVFSTLHTNDAKQTLDRIVDTFPATAHHQVRAMLALTLRAVVSQRLVRRADGTGRVAAVEVLINSPNIRDLIAEGKTSQIEKVIASSGDYYKMQTFNQSLAKLVLDGVISQDEAVGCSTNPGDLRLLLKGVTTGSVCAQKAAPEAPKPAPDVRPAPEVRPPLKITRSF